MYRDSPQAEKICDYIIEDHAGASRAGRVDKQYVDDCCRLHPSKGLPHQRQRVTLSFYFLQFFVLFQHTLKLRHY